MRKPNGRRGASLTKDASMGANISSAQVPTALMSIPLQSYQNSSNGKFRYTTKKNDVQKINRCLTHQGKYNYKHTVTSHPKLDNFTFIMHNTNQNNQLIKLLQDTQPYYQFPKYPYLRQPFETFFTMQQR